MLAFWKLANNSLLARIAFCIFAIAFLLSPAAAEVNCRSIQKLLQTASEIRGLRPKSQVECRVADRSEIEQYIRDALKKHRSSDQLKSEERMYKLLGLIPQDYPYEEGLIALYTNEIGGYYDPETKRYSMANWIGDILQYPIAIHELTHALQDQYFDLEKFIDEEQLTTDELLARLAVVEGDASSVMDDAERKEDGEPQLQHSQEGTVLSQLTSFLFTGHSTSAKLSITTPDALRAMLIFPYVSGSAFVHHQLRLGGYKRVNELFRHPPKSTSEILHPERYRKGLPSVQLEPLPLQLAKSADSKVRLADTLGEFVASAMLSNWTARQRVADILSYWVSDRVALYQITEPTVEVLTYRIRLANETAARALFDTFIDAYTVRFSAAPQSTAPEIRVWEGLPGIGNVKLWRSTAEVQLQIGLF